MIPVLAVAVLCAFGPTRADPREDGVEFFEREIRPLLVEKCVRCHGPKNHRSNLRLDSGAAILAGGARGPAFVPGDPEASLLITAVRYADEDLAMPPKGKLADEEIEALVEWIRNGADLPQEAGSVEAVEPGFDLAERARHWAFQPLAEPDPAGTIDGYLQRRLKEEGLQPAGEAEARTLLRRLSFDLTGLPPAPDWLEERVDRPFEVVVDELLDSPHYGERWGRHWLDLVRYAESRGHEFDFDIPQAYQYRDYVVRAFNRDVPFDQFAREHVAGDLIRPPRLDPETSANESILGTGFWFLGTAMHSPVDIRADETDRTANQIDVLSRAFLGLTVACARCHDHKFDAITAEDFYALSGFALSGSYRQVRFQTMEHNSAVAASLDELGRQHDFEVRRALGAFLEGQALQVREHLEAASAVAFDRGPDSTDEEVIPEHIDLLFEDFERESYAPWSTTGTAFGSGPRRAADLPDYQGALGQRGERVVNSHNVLHGEDGAGGEAHVGTLTSPPFVVARDYVHFLIGGGAHEETAVRLEVEGEVVASAQGPNANALAPTHFDVREWRGRTARLVVVDEHSAGWGNVGIDHVVFSDREEEGVLDLEMWPAEAARRARLLEEQSRRLGLAPQDIAAWARELTEAVDSESSLLHPFAFLAATTQALDPATRARQFDYVFEALAHGSVGDRVDGRVLVDFGVLDEARWSQDGFGFGPRPASAGAVRITGREGGVREGGVREGDSHGLAVDIATEPGAYWDPTWDVLRSAEGTLREPGEIDWEQSGGLLRTPTVTLDGGRLFYLVRGSGHAFAVVDAHRLVNGPLHGETKRSLEADATEFAWVEHDLRAYAGHRVHIEFSPRRMVNGPSDFAVARVVEAGEAPAEGGFGELLRDLQGGEPTLTALADRYEQVFRDAARRLAEGELEGPADTQRLAWLLRRSSASPKLPAPFLSEREALLERIRPVSHLAPAMLEGSGVDEHVLVRGNPQTPGDLAHRRYLEVFDGRDPLVHGEGSGRLELAWRLTDPEQPLFARVWANRVWHHLFGRGIVASVDDFGHMGEEPSHPALLDHLANRLIEKGWSTKALIREIVLSAAYRMSGQEDPVAAERDPDNRLLHHAPRRRLEGEAIRDALLAVSGGLDRSLYGAPIPAHLTEFAQGRGKPETSGPLDGAGRRSLYLALRRNFMTPFFQVFDAPPPATTMGRRSVSNVPAQALTMLNDPFVLAEAQRWAKRVLEEPGRSPEQRVTDMYRAAFARAPDEAELGEALAFVQHRCADYGVAVDDPSAWADLSHVLFNLKEFIFLD